MTEPLAVTTVQSPLGPIAVVASAAGVRELVLPGMATPRSRGALDVDGMHLDATEICRRAAAELDEYFRGARARFDVAVDLRGTDFQRAAWAALCDIPFGTTLTYGEQARRMGRDGASRAVGAANGRNPVPIIVPCHRVVGADGSLVGYAARTLGDAGLAMKSWLLAHERAVVDRSTTGRAAAATAGSTAGSTAGITAGITAGSSADGTVGP